MQTDEYAKLFENEDTYWWFVARRELALRLLHDAVGRNPEAPVLDLGCGTGAVLSAMPETYRAVGVDMSELATDFCRQRGLRRLARADGTALPFRDASFSGIVALDIFEHIQDDHAAFAEAHRVLKPGGSLVLSVPAYRWLWGPHDVALMHHRRYQLREVKRCVRLAGFRVTRASYGVFLLFPLVVILRISDRLSRRPATVSLPRVDSSQNHALVRLQSLESRLIAKGAPLPWGSSVVVVATKIV